jgi:signal transduction histidine kinase
MKINDLLERNLNPATLTQEAPEITHLPHVKPQQTIIEAYHLMKAHNTDSLRVYDGQKFIGIVTLSKIMDRLVKIVGENKQNYQRAIHDLRNPLFNLQGLVNLLIETTETQENLDLLHLCNLSCKHGRDILEDLLYVEIDENKPLSLVQTELNYFYGQCVKEQIGLALLKNIKIVTELSTEPVIRSIDRSHLKRAVQNVISNAVKFSYPQSVVKISSKIEDEKLILKIVDAGVGIPEHLQPEVFNKFTKAQRPGTGGEASTGLGLCFSRQCIEQHNGAIYFKSTEGKGTKFYIAM